MTGEQLAALGILGSAIGLFLWGRLRHDLVALATLVAAVATGLVPGERAFDGFAQPAVITVAAVLALSSGLETSGAVARLARLVIPDRAGPLGSLVILCSLVAALSAFMNNVGAFALLMPVVVQQARKLGVPAGRMLMPVAFASILGGTTTLIGTPPNLIVAGARAQATGVPFSMLDFAPVGLAVTASGLVVLVALARWLVPARETARADRFELAAYLTEGRVVEGSDLLGRSLAEVEERLEEVEAQILGLVRGGEPIVAPRRDERVAVGDVLLIEADPEALERALDRLGLVLEGVARAQAKGGAGEAARGPAAGAREQPVLGELVVLPNSSLVGRSARVLRLRSHYAVNLLAVAREGGRPITRLRNLPIRSGDVLLVQGAPEAIGELARERGCVPLAERGLRLPERRRALLATAIMAGAVLMSATGLLPPAVAFVAGALAAMASNVVPPRTAYQVIDWPVVVVLGAMAPLADAMASTGTADLLARLLLGWLEGSEVWVVLLALLAVTMTLSEAMNNAATAALMAPIAVVVAARLEADPDPFLMAVAVGASSAFLTPIGHQNNTLILGPGGFRFGDYWPLGLPLEIVVAGVAVPMLLWVWPP